MGMKRNSKSIPKPNSGCGRFAELRRRVSFNITLRRFSRAKTYTNDEIRLRTLARTASELQRVDKAAAWWKHGPSERIK
jgi:hypothetical protein